MQTSDIIYRNPLRLGWTNYLTDKFFCLIPKGFWSNEAMDCFHMLVIQGKLIDYAPFSLRVHIKENDEGV